MILTRACSNFWTGWRSTYPLSQVALLDEQEVLRYTQLTPLTTVWRALDNPKHSYKRCRRSVDWWILDQLVRYNSFRNILVREKAKHKGFISIYHLFAGEALRLFFVPEWMPEGLYLLLLRVCVPYICSVEHMSRAYLNHVLFVCENEEIRWCYNVSSIAANAFLLL